MESAARGDGAGAPEVCAMSSPRHRLRPEVGRLEGRVCLSHAAPGGGVNVAALRLTLPSWLHGQDGGGAQGGRGGGPRQIALRFASQAGTGRYVLQGAMVGQGATGRLGVRGGPGHFALLGAMPGQGASGHLALRAAFAGAPGGSARR
jgi:hypothetical protein